MNCATHTDAAAVAYCRTCGKPLCANCSRDVRGVIYCEGCLAARLEGVQPPAPAAGFVAGAPAAASSGPNPGLAGILGAIPFGVGAVYCGQYVKGLVHLGVFVLLIVAVSSNVPWFVHTALGIGIAFFWVYQIVDSVRTARAIQAGQPAPDPLGLAGMFAPAEGINPSKVPFAAIVLIGLGVLFLLHTMGVAFFDLDRFWPIILIVIGVWLFARRWGLVGPRYGNCGCDRCRARCLMGPAVLVTLGVLFLLESQDVVGFGRTWPVLLVVIGLVKVFQGSASDRGHVGTLPPAQSGTPPAGVATGEVQSPPSEVKNG